MRKHIVSAFAAAALLGGMATATAGPADNPTFGPAFGTAEYYSNSGYTPPGALYVLRDGVFYPYTGEPQYALDNRPRYDSRTADRDRDGIPDRFDRDRDGDGVLNANDRFPDDPRRF